MTRWGMVIDLRKCIGCRACTVICAEANRMQPDTWRQVVDGGIDDKRERLFLSMSCMHCANPPCLEVCPTTATYRRSDGIIDVNYDLCVGCAYCVVACPYLARTIVSNNLPHTGTDIIPSETDGTQPGLERVGVCTKCNFCAPRVDGGLVQGLQPGIDVEATPMCVVSCNSHALYFGDLDDPNSVVVQLIRENKTTTLQEELGTSPAIYYIVD